MRGQRLQSRGSKFNSVSPSSFYSDSNRIQILGIESRRWVRTAQLGTPDKSCAETKATEAAKAIAERANFMIASFFLER